MRATKVCPIRRDSLRSGAIRVFTDGSSSNTNTRVAAWGVVLLLPGERFQVRSGVIPPPSTNQEAELRAVVEGLEWAAEFITDRQQIEIVSDSKYVINGPTKYLPEWRDMSDWTTKNDEPVMYRELWERLDALDGPYVTWTHIRGHRGNLFNEMADRVAVRARESYIRG